MTLQNKLRRNVALELLEVFKNYREKIVCFNFKNYTVNLNLHSQCNFYARDNKKTNSAHRYLTAVTSAVTTNIISE